MRLRQIKIAGFKSFADPVLIELDEPVVGIVGPNGCGKSNIIDAVRWVLGEARVAELRGSSSMKELIFAGSSGRKPMGRASVELTLTNEDGTLKGPWASYAEISVKRQVMGEGQSTYFINGQVVRRRDVQEIFLGTGLGPRSYAIISQGMIASFVKARPEELRQYLEEAAGVSLYRERRHETENLLASTRQNLERAQDLQHVKEEELVRLEAEAAVALEWQRLNKERLETESLWYFLQYEDVRKSLNKLESEIAEIEAQLAQKHRLIQEHEQQLPTLKAEREAAQTAAGQAQAQLREAERHLTLFEGERKRIIDQRAESETVIKETQSAIEQKTQEFNDIEAKLAGLETQCRALNDALEGLQDEAEAYAETLFEKEEALEKAQDSYEAQRQRGERANHASIEAKNHHAELERRLADLNRRLSRLDMDFEANETKPNPEELSLLEDQLIELEETIASLVDEDEEKRAELEAARKAREAANEAYFASLAEEKELAAKLSTLKAIQEKAEASDQLSQYEERKGIAGLARLSEALVMPEAWVGAIEALLRHRANAVELRFLETTLSFEEDRPPSPMSFIDAATIARPAGTDPDSLTLSTQGLETPETLTIGESSFTSLLSVMSFKSDAAKRIVPLWLAGVYGVESLKAAMRVRASLPVGVTLVTPVGDRVTRHSVEFWASSDPSEGILSRKLEIERLENALLDLADTLDSKNKERLEGAERVEELESDCQTLSSTLKAEQVNQQALTLKVEKFRSALEAYERREADRQKSRQELLEETEIVNETLEVAIERLDALELERGGIERDVDVAKKALHQAEQAAKLAREAQAKANHLAQMKTLEFKQASENQRLFTGRLSALKEDIAREQHRQDGAKAKLTELEGKHDDAELEKALATFKSAEEAANQANQVLLEKEALLETAQNNWHSWQSSLLPLTESIGQKRGDVQVKMGLKSQFDERLTDLGADRIALRMKVETDHPKITTVRNRVQTLINDITALGPINHAALEHLGAAKRAIEETQHQIADLFGAIDTLENAIRKIDQETRDRMKETFDQVNAYFAETFTDLFGGGSAALTMVGEDILQAGVEIRAQPPGKRNNSVRLLSGGEQALTATALVFGLFKLNPAPFCLLDEVDAPLDEANQARLAQMCTRLSSETQFLIITHHRVTMEYARALIGVTMKEPGVSRIVSVAVEDAVNMVNNG